MGNVHFLNDSACRDAIVRMTSEATRLWAPGEMDLVGVAADEYFRQVQDAGRILYPAKTAARPLGFEGCEFWMLVILPVATGFIGNLLAEAGVGTFKELKSRVEQRQRSKETAAKPRPIPFGPDRIRPLIESKARSSGMSSRQIEQLPRLFSNVISEFLLTNGP